MTASENIPSRVSSSINRIKQDYIFVDLFRLGNELHCKFQEHWKSSWGWNYQEFIDDWLFLCLLIGNDFLPNLPSCEIHEDVISRLMEIYAENILRFHRYLINNGKPDLEIVQNILTDFSKEEEHIFIRRHEQKQRRQQNDPYPSNHKQSPYTPPPPSMSAQPPFSTPLNAIF